MTLFALLLSSTFAHAQWYGDGLIESTDSDASILDTSILDGTILAGDVLDGDALAEDETLTLSAWVEPSMEDCQDLDWLNVQEDKTQRFCRELLVSRSEDMIAEAEANGMLRYGERAFDNSGGVPVVYETARGSILEEWEHRASYRDTTEVEYTEQGWESNGDRIDSCEEYAYQRFYDYSLFEAASRNADDRYDQIAQLAFDPFYVGAGAMGVEGATGRGFSTMDGHRFSDDQFGPGPWQSDPYVSGRMIRPKNTFFDLNDTELAAIDAIDASMAARLRDGRRYWRTYDWGTGVFTAPAPGAGHIENRWMFHARQSVNLSDPARSTFFKQKRDHFARIVAERRAMEAAGADPSRRGDWIYVSDVGERLSALDGELYNLLLEAEAMGCLRIASTDPADLDAGHYDYNACDWAPEDFHDEIVATAEQKKQVALDACRSSANFQDLASYGGYEYYDASGALHSEGDPRTDVLAFRTYLERMKESDENRIAAATAAYNPKKDGVPWYSRKYEAGDSYGADKLFSAEWNAGIGWHLFDIAGGEVCDINPWFKANANASAHLFAQKIPIIDALVHLHARKDIRKVDFAIFGGDLINESWESKGHATAQRLNYHYAYNKNWGVSQDFVRADFAFTIWIIPVTINGALTGKVGVDYGMNAQLSEKQKLVGSQTVCYELYGEVAATARPYVGVEGRVAMGVGVPGLGFGAYGRLNIVTVALPSRLAVSATSTLDLANPTITISGKSSLDIDTLNGEVGGYVEFGVRHEAELFRWRGYEIDVPVFDEKYSTDVQLWGGICTLPGVDCAG
ncbi:MAG: hypothetical protein AAFV53_03780 [Myxococcota bacterium]